MLHRMFRKLRRLRGYARYRGFLRTKKRKQIIEHIGTDPALAPDILEVERFPTY